jgi:hypothetical protein
MLSRLDDIRIEYKARPSFAFLIKTTNRMPLGPNPYNICSDAARSTRSTGETCHKKYFIFATADQGSWPVYFAPHLHNPNAFRRSFRVPLFWKQPLDSTQACHKDFVFSWSPIDILHG